jgi:hypothetical protein
VAAQLGGDAAHALAAVLGRAAAMAEDSTSLVTVLSSAHGRQRRAEHEIHKRDLQAAVKYGVKESAGVCRIFGKYTFADVVFITDATSRQEITSWPLPGCGFDAPLMDISAAAAAENARAHAALRARSGIWTSHTVFVVDQSGSMRKIDTADGSTRSDAVWLTLACTWVSDQLTSGAAKQTDVISVIGMNADSTLLVDRHPVNWTLYNTLIGFLRTAMPASDGNYIPALNMAETCLLANTHGSCALLLLFLSDGKPSDKPLPGFGACYSYEHKLMREEQFSGAIGRLASRFGRRLTVGTIGFGPSTEDFSVLRLLASTSALYHSTGVFQKPELTAHSLRMALSTLSSTLTATKTEMTELGGSSQRVVRDVRREPQSAGNETLLDDDSWLPCCISFERVAWSSKAKDWIPQARLVSPVAVSFAIRKNIFGEGAERMVRKFREFDASGVFVGKPMVAKESRFVDDLASPDRKAFHRVFCETQQQAQVLALEFNKRLAAVPGVDSSTPRVQFLACSIYVVGGTVGYLVEEMIDPARYKKYNSNNGYVDGVSAAVPAAAPHALPEPAAVPTVLGAIAEESDEEGEDASDDESSSAQAPPPSTLSISAADIPQAFSHFSHNFSKRKMMVCDLQGVLETDCNPPVYKLTDPVIHYSSSRGRTNVFGRTDRGKKGINSFFRTHKCSELCRALNREWVRPEPRQRPDTSSIGEVLAAALARTRIE